MPGADPRGYLRGIGSLVMATLAGLLRSMAAGLLATGLLVLGQLPAFS